MSLLERVAPNFAARREVSRIVTAELRRIQSGAAASSNPVGTQRSETRWRGASRMLRSLAGWLPKLGSGKSDNPRVERETTVARSYDAYRNHPIARAIITRRRTSVVGTGLICHPSVDAKVLGITEDEAQKLNETIESQWRLWAEDPAQCDVEATLDFYGQTALAEVSAAAGGDCFALTPVDDDGIKVQLIDGARVSNPRGESDSASLIDGVALEPTGRPRGYWIRRKHPDDRYDTSADYWDFYRAFGAETGRRRVMHIWEDKDRIGQVRGMPLLAPILEPLQQLTTLSRAELTASVVSALISVFIKRDKTQGITPGNPAAFPGVQEAADGKTSSLSLGAGAIIDLGFGEEPVAFNPTRPNAKFEAFWLACLTEIGSAVEIPVDEMILRYNASYSAARAAMLQAWRGYLVRRWMRVQQFCQPVYCLWFDWKVATGKIPVSDYADPIRRAAYNRAVWTGPARGSMDEEKEASAAAKRIETGISNETIETAAMMGEEWTTVNAQRSRELARKRQNGTLPLEKPSPTAASESPKQADPAAPTAPGEDDDEPDPEKEAA